MHFDNNEFLEIVEGFKYLGLEVPSNHRWNECATHRLDVSYKVSPSQKTYSIHPPTSKDCRIHAYGSKMSHTSTFYNLMGSKQKYPKNT